MVFYTHIHRRLVVCACLLDVHADCLLSGMVSWLRKYLVRSNRATEQNKSAAITGHRLLAVRRSYTWLTVFPTKATGVAKTSTKTKQTKHDAC